MGLSSMHNHSSRKPESGKRNPDLLRKKPLEQEASAQEAARLKQKKGIFSRTIVDETELKSDILKSRNGDVREQSTHRKAFNFWDRSMGGRKTTISSQELSEATKVAAAKWLALKWVHGDLGRFDIGGIPGWLIKLLRSKPDVQSAIEIAGERYGPEVEAALRRNLANIQASAPAMLDKSMARKKMIPDTIGQVFWTKSQNHIRKYYSNVNNPDQLAKMNVQDAVVDLLVGWAGLAMGGVFFKVPLPIVVQRIPVPNDREAFPDNAVVWRAIDGLAADTRRGLFSKWKYDQNITREGANLSHAKSYETGVSIRSSFPVLWFLAHFNPREWLMIEQRIRKHAELVASGNGHTPEAMQLSGQIRDRLNYFDKKLEDRIAKGKVTKYGDEYITEVRLEEQRMLVRDISARSAEAVSEEDGFLVYMGQKLWKDLKLSPKPEIRELWKQIERYSKSGSPKELQSIKSHPKFQEMYTASRNDTGGFGTWELWQQNNILWPQRNVSTAKWMWGGSAESLWMKSRNPEEYISALFGTSNRNKNLAVAQMALLQNSLGDGRDNDVFLSDLQEAMKRGKHVPNCFWRNSGIGSQRLGDRNISNGPGLAFTMEVDVGGKKVETPLFIADRCFNLMAGQPVTPDTIFNNSVPRFLEIPIVIGTGWSGGGSPNNSVSSTPSAGGPVNAAGGAWQIANSVAAGLPAGAWNIAWGAVPWGILNGF
jgi:hypothetical protein